MSTSTHLIDEGVLEQDPGTGTPETEPAWELSLWKPIRQVLAPVASLKLTVALLGYDGGEIRRQSLADHCIVVGSDYIPRIQEVQASIYHLMRELLDDR